jgi:hypothetical protein
VSQVRVRFVGGPLNGQAVWIDETRASISVQVAQSGSIPTHTLEYRREGGMLVFIEPHPPATV